MTCAYKLVVFDWEGTLADTFGQVMQITQEKAQNSGYLPLNKIAFALGIQSGLLNAIKKGFSHLSQEEHHKLLTDVQQGLCVKSPAPYLFPGAIELIKQLHHQGVKLAIATNKSQQSFQLALQKSELSEYFEITRAAGQSLPKPHPQMLLEILELLSLKPQQAVMVGDSVSDVDMACRVSMDAIGVDFYEQDAEMLMNAGAKIIVHDFDQLSEFLGVSSRK